MVLSAPRTRAPDATATKGDLPGAVGGREIKERSFVTGMDFVTSGAQAEQTRCSPLLPLVQDTSSTPPPFPSRFGRCVRPVSPHRPARQPKNLPGYCLQPTYIYFLRPESKGFTTHAIFAEAGYETSLKRL